VVLVYGDAMPLVEEAVREVLAEYGPEAEPASFNRSTFRASDEDAAQALGDARTPPMMASLRLVDVREIEQGTNAFYEALEDYLQHPSPDSLLVLSGAGFPRVRKGGRAWHARIPKRVKAVGAVRRLQVKDVDRRRFVIDRSAALGRTLTRPAADLLVALVGEDLGLLARQVELLDVATDPDRSIDVEDVGEAIASTAGGDAFEVLRAVVSRRPDEALGRVSLLLDRGASVDQFMGALMWKARQMVSAYPMVRSGRTPFDISKALRMRRGDAADLVRLFGEHPAPRGLVPRIVETWTQLRAGGADPNRRVEALILELAQG